MQDQWLSVSHSHCLHSRTLKDHACNQIFGAMLQLLNFAISKQHRAKRCALCRLLCSCVLSLHLWYSKSVGDTGGLGLGTGN